MNEISSLSPAAPGGGPTKSARSSAIPASILILKPSSLGDVLQAIPVLRLLRLRFPNAFIAWWVDASLVPLLEGDPDLNEVIPFNRAELRRWQGGRRFVRSVLEMRRRHFDWVIDLQGLLRSGLVSWIANGGLTIGVDDPREGASAFYDLAVRRASATTHAVDWYLEVLRTLGVPVHQDFQWLPIRPEVLESVERKWPTAGRRWICLQPGARWWNKRWPIEHFEQLIRELRGKNPDFGFAILGGSDDRAFGERLASIAPDRSVDLTGRTTLLEMIEWLRRSELMVTNDTGPMHAAAALGKPVVGLFGPTDPRRTGPYGQETLGIRLGLPCSPCLKQRCHYASTLECLRGITPHKVLSAIQERLP